MKNKKVFIATIFFVILTTIGGIKTMAERNIQMGQRNADNTDWNLDYPITKAENVLTTSGTLIGDIAQIATNKANILLKANQSSLDTTNASILLKSDKTYVDTLTASIASGSPKATFTTLALHKPTLPLIQLMERKVFTL